MNYSSSASARQVVPELPDSEFPSSPVEQAPQDQGRGTLKYLQLLWSRRRTLLRVAACAFVASVIIAFLISPRYESTTRLMPPDNQSSSGLALAAAAMSGAGGGSLAGIAGDLLGLKSTSDVFVGILGSRTVQDKLIEQFDLKKLYSLGRMDYVRKMLARNTAISVDRKSQIIYITVTDSSPQRAAAMAQAYVDELNHLVADLSTSSARRERIFLEGRLAAVNLDLESAEKEFSQFASKNATIDVKEQGKAMVEAAATLQGQLIAAKSQYEGLRQIYSDNNARVRSLKARIDELQRELEKLGGKGESAAIVSEQSSDSMYPSIRKLPLLGVRYADLYRRAKIQEAVLETLTKEYELAKVQEAKEIPSVKVLDDANVPDTKSYPPRALVVFLGTILATAFAALLICGSASWQAIDAQNPGKQFALEVWGDVRSHVPWVTSNGTGLATSKKRFWNRFAKTDESERQDR